MPSRLEKSVLRKCAKEVGITVTTLLAALVTEYCSLPKDKQIELIGDHFHRVASRVGGEMYLVMKKEDEVNE